MQNNREWTLPVDTVTFARPVTEGTQPISSAQAGWWCLYEL